jgi:hypothetical protein
MKFAKILISFFIIVLALGAVSASQETDNNLTAIDDAMIVEDSNLAVAADDITVGDGNSTDDGNADENIADESGNGTDDSKKPITADDFFVYTKKSLAAQDDDWDEPQILVADFPENGTLKIFVNDKLKFTKNVDAQKDEFVSVDIDGVKQKLGIKTVDKDYKISIKYTMENETVDLADYSFSLYDEDAVDKNNPIFIDDLLILKDNNCVVSVTDPNARYVVGTVKVAINGKKVYSKSFKASNKIRYLDIKSSEIAKGYVPGKYKVKVTYASNTGKSYSATQKVKFVKTVPEIYAPEDMSAGENQSIIITSAKGTTGTASLYQAVVKTFEDTHIKFYKKVGKLLDVNIVNGYANIPLSNLTTGTYGFILEYNVEGYKNSQEFSVKVFNNSEGFSAKVVPSQISFGETVKVKAYSPENVSYLYEYIDIDNDQYVADLKIMSGYASKILYGLNVGKHTVRVHFDDGKTYFSKTFDVVVKKSDISLVLEKTDVKKSASKLKLTATLKIKGKAAKNKEVTFKFNKKTFKVKTNKKGIATVSIAKKHYKNLKVGKKVSYTVSYGKVVKIRTAKIVK